MACGQLVGALALVAMLSSCVCTASECGSSENGVFELRRSREELREASMVACRNDVCQAVSLAVLAELVVDARVSLRVLEADANSRVMLSASAQPTSGGFAVSLLWDIGVTSEVKVGDRLSARVLTKAGDELFSGAGEVAVVTRDPDGCGPPCNSAQVTLK
jgi:hypothetical protein